MGDVKRASMPVSLPTDLIEELDVFVDRFGKPLGYRGRSDFIAAAIRNLRDQDEQRVLRLRAIDEGSETATPVRA